MVTIQELLLSFNFTSFLGVQKLLTHERKICAYLSRKLLLNSLKPTRVKKNRLMYKEVKQIKYMWQELVSESDTPMLVSESDTPISI